MPVIFGIIIIITVLIAYEKRKSEKLTKKTSEHFWDKEREANLVRRKDISNLPYIIIPCDSLPLSDHFENEELEQLRKQLLSLSEQRILNLTGLTNTEIKLTYGTANLSILCEYDQNFLVLLRTLSRFASLLYEAGNSSDAETILTYALQIGSDIHADFQLLARIYHDRKDIIGLDALIQRAESLSSLRKTALLSTLNKLRLDCTTIDALDEYFARAKSDHENL